jgi:hypothetical protein
LADPLAPGILFRYSEDEIVHRNSERACDPGTTGRLSRSPT